MTQQLDATATPAKPRSFGGLILQAWPYLLMVLLGVVGVALSSVWPTKMIVYWEALVPAFAIICFFARGPSEMNESVVKALRQDILHWAAVLLTMRLIMRPEVQQMLNADSLGYLLLAILALGTFLAGNQIGSWKIGLTGLLLALSILAIAWVERTILLISLAGVAIVLLVLYLKPSKR